MSVDAGRVPADVEAFFPADPDLPRRRLCAILAMATLGIAVGFAATGIEKELVALMIIAAGVLGVSSYKTLPEEDEEEPLKRPTLVVTQTGIALRDHEGLRTWRFEEVEEIRPYVYERRLGLLVVRGGGRADFIDCYTYQRGERVRELLRLRAHRPTF